MKASTASRAAVKCAKTVQIKERKSTNPKDADERDNLPKDIYRCFDQVTVEDVWKFTDYVEAPLYATTTVGGVASKASATSKVSSRRMARILVRLSINGARSLCGA